MHALCVPTWCTSPSGSFKHDLVLPVGKSGGWVCWVCADALLCIPSCICVVCNAMRACAHVRHTCTTSGLEPATSPPFRLVSYMLLWYFDVYRWFASCLRSYSCRYEGHHVLVSFRRVRPASKAIRCIYVTLCLSSMQHRACTTTVAHSSSITGVQYCKNFHMATLINCVAIRRIHLTPSVFSFTRFSLHIWSLHFIGVRGNVVPTNLHHKLSTFKAY